MKSNHAAKMAGVSPDTLHYYEKRGLLRAPPLAPNGYRDYSPAHVSKTVGCFLTSAGDLRRAEERNSLTHFGKPSQEILAKGAPFLD